MKHKYFGLSFEQFCVKKGGLDSVQANQLYNKLQTKDDTNYIFTKKELEIVVAFFVCCGNKVKL